jgi:hypothetical protein
MVDAGKIGASGRGGRLKADQSFPDTPPIMPTVKELRGMAKTAKIKKYYRMNKAQLMAALGVQDTPRKTKAVGKKQQQIVKDLVSRPSRQLISAH